MKHFYRIILILFFYLYGSPVYAQSWTWAVNAKGNHQYSNADRKIATDQNGNSYLAGYYTKTFRLGDFTLTNPSDYYNKIYLAKLDASGQVLWLRDIDAGDSYADGIALTLDDYGNCYLTGTIQARIFVSKYDTMGKLIWKNDFNRKYYGYGKSIALDQADNVYIIGETGGSATFSNGVFMAKLNDSGQTTWTKVYESICHSNGASGGDIAVDALGNSYITGLFACDYLEFDGLKVLNSGGSSDKAFVAKISPRGQALWAQQIPNLVSLVPQVALTEASEIIVAGMSSFCCSEPTPQLFKYTSEGILTWMKQGRTYRGIPKDLVCDYEGNIYLGGTSFGYYGGTEMDFHLEKYDTNGQFIWNREVKNASGDYLFGISLDNNGNVYAVGSSPIVTLGVFGSGVMNEASTTFIAKLNTTGTTTQRPYKPKINSVFPVCDGQQVPSLEATGQQITWYDSPTLQKVMHQGPAFKPAITKTDTFYVTQTIDNKRSWSKQVVVFISDLNDFTIRKSNDTLYAPAAAAYTYQWFHNDSLLTSATQPYFVPDTVGTFKVIVSDGYCSKESSFTNSAPLLPGENAKLMAYPNPAPDAINLIVKLRQPGEYILNIYSNTGLLLFSFREEDQEEIRKEIDISQWAKGLYFCELLYQSERKTIRFVKI